MNETGSLTGLLPPLGHRFLVTIFCLKGWPSPVDFRFQKVSGIGSTISTRTFNEGGQNLYVHRLPERVEYENLVLERGLVIIGSPLVYRFNQAMEQFSFNPCLVLVTLHELQGIPITGWLFRNAYPVKWEISEFNADENAVVIESMELAYQNMLTTRI